MSKLNLKPKDRRVDLVAPRLAGGYGPRPATQGAEALLRRAVMACLLWEDLAYESGKANAENIASLIPQVAPETVAQIAIEAREKQKLRHVPLFIVNEMAKLPGHKAFVAEVLPRVCTRADMITDFVALYLKPKKQPLSAQVKRGLAEAMRRQSAYGLAKYNRAKEVKFRDVLRLTHAEPKDLKQAQVWKALMEGTLASPDTWEVALSAGANKQATWTRLIQEKKIGSLAFLRNLRNMQQAGVPYDVLQQGFANLRGQMLLPLNFLAAQKAAPELTREIETAMLACYAELPKLPGWTVFVLDTSGSMREAISGKSHFSRLQVGAAMMMLAAERTERISLYMTAGNDRTRVHATAKVPSLRGFGLLEAMTHAKTFEQIGQGGIFTRQALQWIQNDLKDQTPDRIMVFSDSQDCDLDRNTLPRPFGKHNYIVDVSANARGINYAGVWTSEISGWSEHFLAYVEAMEGLSVPEVAQEEDTEIDLQ